MRPVPPYGGGKRRASIPGKAGAVLATCGAPTRDTGTSMFSYTVVLGKCHSHLALFSFDLEMRQIEPHIELQLVVGGLDVRA